MKLEFKISPRIKLQHNYWPIQEVFLYTDVFVLNTAREILGQSKLKKSRVGADTLIEGQVYTSSSITQKFNRDYKYGIKTFF